MCTPFAAKYIPIITIPTFHPPRIDRQTTNLRLNTVVAYTYSIRIYLPIYLPVDYQPKNQTTYRRISRVTDKNET